MQVIPLPPGNIELGDDRSGIYLPCLTSLGHQVGIDYLSEASSMNSGTERQNGGYVCDRGVTPGASPRYTPERVVSRSFGRGSRQPEATRFHTRNKMQAERFQDARRE